MNVNYYISLYSSISKTIWILLLTTIVLEFYLVQRCFEVNSHIQEKIIDLDNPYSDDPVTLGKIIDTLMKTGQQQTMGFKINYGTLSLLWPIVLFALFITIRYSLNKRIEVLKELHRFNPEFNISSLRLDLFSLFFKNRRDHNIIFTLLFYVFPLMGLSFHAYSGYYMYDLILSSIQPYKDYVGYKNDQVINTLNLLFVIQILFSIVFLILTFLANRKSFQNYNASTSMLSPISD